MPRRPPASADIPCALRVSCSPSNAERSAGKDWRIVQEEKAAQFADLIEWNERFAAAQQQYISQLERLLDQHELPK
jgi:hypothetical protein